MGRWRGRAVSGSVDDYLAGLNEPVRGAEQGKSYAMAALRHRGKPLLGFLSEEIVG